MSKIRFAAIILLTASTLPLPAGPGTSNPYGGRRVLVIGIDGCRADALKLQVDSGNAPNIASLIANGTVTWNAYSGGDPGTATQQVTSSGPNWTSILTGTWIDRHNVNGNSSPAYNQPAVPGSYLIDQAPHFAKYLKAHDSGTYIASIVNWDWIETYIVAAQTAHFNYHTTSTLAYDFRDGDVAAQAANLMATADPDAVFLQFDQTDHAGHAGGFTPSNTAYLAAIANVDTLVGNVISAINSRPQIAAEKWMTIIISDHGGTSGGSHGGQSIEERTIPFIVSGGGLPAGIVSTATPGDVAVAPTVMRHLGLNIPAAWQYAQPAFVTGPVLTATASAHQVNVAWSPAITPVPGAASVEILRDGTSLGIHPLTGSLTDTGAPGGNFIYQLRFINASGTVIDDAGVSATVFVVGSGQRLWDDANTNNNWNLTDANWAFGDTFATGDEVFFTGPAGETVTVDAAGVTPSATHVTGGLYTFSGGSILGGPLVKTSTGALMLSSANSFSSVSVAAGPDSQTSGSLVPGNTGSLGTGSITFENTANMTGIQFPAPLGSAAFSNNIILSSPASAVTTRLLTDETNVTITLSGILSGGNSNQELLIDNDSGTNDSGKIRLTNPANTFTVSRIRLNRGGLVVTSDGALGNANNPITLDVTSNLASSGLILEGAPSLGAGHSITVSSQTVIDSGSTTGSSIAGPITGSANIVRRGTTSLVPANNTSTHSGGWTIATAPGTGATQGSLHVTSASLNASNVFSGLGTGAITVTSAGTILSSAVSGTVNNNIVLPNTANRHDFVAANTRELTLAGVISGGGTSIPTFYVNTDASGGSTGFLKLTNANNTFQGKIQMNRGGLAITSDGALGNAANAIFFDIGTATQIGLRFDAPMSSSRAIQLGGGKQVFDTNGNAVTLSGVISGASGQLFKSGAGSLSLSNTHTYAGATTVDAGTLLVNGSLNTSTSAVTVSSAGSLGGSGTIGRPVTVNGNLSPGDNGVGILTVANTLTLAGGSSLSIQMSDWNGSAGAGHDSLIANSIALTATSGSKLTLNLDFTGVTHFTETNKNFTIATATTAPAGLAADNWTIVPTGFPGAGTWSLQSSGNNLTLVYTASPFVSWTTSKGLSGNDAAFGADPDGDGIPNGIEFVLGTEPNPANPGSNSSASLPTVSVSGNSLVFTFKRADAASDFLVSTEFSPTPAGGWTTAVDPDNSTISTTDGNPLDTISVAIPNGSNTKLFVRLKVVNPD